MGNSGIYYLHEIAPVENRKCRPREGCIRVHFYKAMSCLPKDVVVVGSFRSLLLSWFLVDFKCPVGYLSFAALDSSFYFGA